MIEIPKIAAPFVLIGLNGTRRTFFTRLDVVNALGRRFLEKDLGAAFTADVVKHHVYGDGTVWREVVRPGVRFVLTDARGRVLQASDFADLFQKPWPWWAWRYRFYNGEGPVPGTRKWKAGQHMYRRPRTAQERRMAILVDPDDALAPPRPCRTGLHLPSAWDDLYPTSRRNNSWKQFRKTQYKPHKPKTSKQAG